MSERLLPIQYSHSQREPERCYFRAGPESAPPPSLNGASANLEGRPVWEYRNGYKSAHCLESIHGAPFAGQSSIATIVVMSSRKAMEVGERKEKNCSQVLPVCLTTTTSSSVVVFTYTVSTAHTTSPSFYSFVQTLIIQVLLHSLTDPISSWRKIIARDSSSPYYSSWRSRSPRRNRHNVLTTLPSTTLIYAPRAKMEVLHPFRLSVPYLDTTNHTDILSQPSSLYLSTTPQSKAQSRLTN